MLSSHSATLPELKGCAIQQVLWSPCFTHSHIKSSRLTLSNMDVEELLLRYAAGERDFTGAKLPRAKLVGVKLVGVNFWGADLSGANLAKAKLWGANLSGANLSKANLTRANLSGASLNEANLRATKLNSAKLFGASLSGAYYDESTRFSQGFDPQSRNMRKV